MLSDAQRAIIAKDLRAVLASRMMWMPMVILPLILCILIPLGMMLGLHFGQSAMKEAEELLRTMKIENTFASPQEAVITVVVEHVFPTLFLIIPLMVTSILGANSFVGERERKTMETLLYGPITLRELFVAKLAGALIPALVVMFGSALVFGVLVDVGAWLMAGVLPFPTVKWAVMVLWVAPALAALALTVLVGVSARSTNSQEAQQLSALIVLPVVLLLIGQVTGLLMLGTSVLVVAGAVLLGVDVLLLRAVARNFTPERLV